jgi:hypothetical protein
VTSAPAERLPSAPLAVVGRYPENAPSVRVTEGR